MPKTKTATALWKAINASPVYLATLAVHAPERILFVDMTPKRHPCLMVAWLNLTTCNWEPMSGWSDLVDELATRGATPDDAWRPAENSRVRFHDGSEGALLERDMTEAERAALDAAL